MAALRNIESPERGVVVLDPQGRVLQANGRVSEMFGVPLQSLVGGRLPSPLNVPPNGNGAVVDEVLDRQFGECVVHRYSTPVFAEDGSICGRVEIYSDITARRELEKEILDRNTELAELNEQLEDAQEQLLQSERLRTLGEMAAGVAHDINNVLGIILGNCQLAMRKLDPDHPARRSIQGIELAARDGAETVRRLREIGKPVDRSGYAPVDLSEIAGDVIRAALPAWQETSVESVSNVAVEADLADGCVVMGNASELREALANVLLNAVQAIDSRGRIVVRTSVESDDALLTVTDTGCGMSDETRQRVFDPFFTTRGAEGTGLGMSMVDAIAIRHRGRVVLESQEGEGTSVTLRFPRAR